jgi:hypothetical protein
MLCRHRHGGGAGVVQVLAVGSVVGLRVASGLF